MIAQVDAIDLNSRIDDDDDDDQNTNVNASGWGSPEDVRDCDAKGDPTLAEDVGVLTLLPRSSTRNRYIQHPSASLNGNISKPLSVSELTSLCTLFHST